jgi:hypothetical protein
MTDLDGELFESRALGLSSQRHEVGQVIDRRRDRDVLPTSFTPPPPSGTDAAMTVSVPSDSPARRHQIRQYRGVDTLTREQAPPPFLSLGGVCHCANPSIIA